MGLGCKYHCRSCNHLGRYGPKVGRGCGGTSKEPYVCFVVFIAIVVAVWLLGLVGILVVASANLLRKGAVGHKSFTISAAALVEDDGYRTTAVSWRQVRSIDGRVDTFSFALVDGSFCC